VVGATAPANQLNLAQPIYDSIFDPNNPEPFTLYLLVNRATGNGTAKLTVGSYTTSVDFLLADFQPNAGPPITAVGPSIAVSNGPGRSASITVRDFWIYSAVPEPGSWAMMLLGFGAIGLATRASRHVAPFVHVMRLPVRKQCEIEHVTVVGDWVRIIELDYVGATWEAASAIADITGSCDIGRNRSQCSFNAPIVHATILRSSAAYVSANFH
jgi:hypothetical protein